MSSHSKILIVEDELLIAELLKEKLTEFGYQIIGTVSSGEAALEEVQAQLPDLVLMDILLPGKMDGIEVAKKIYENHQIPVLYLTAYADDKILKRAEKTGAYGYLVKPVKDRELLATIKLVINKHREIINLQRSQTLSQDFPEKSDAYILNYDLVTNLPNRLSLQEHFETVLQSLKNTNGNHNQQNFLIPILVIDLDIFSRINNTLGHDTGNIILKKIAHRLSDCLAELGKVIHINADEFAVILKPVTAKNETDSLVQKILNIINLPMQIDQHQIFMTASLGIAFHPIDGEQINLLIQQANKAMKYAKQQGGNQSQIYTENVNPVSLENLSLESDLRYALEREEFEIYYQPRVNIQTGHIVAAEALLRWNHPQRGLVSPGSFIPLAEANGLIEPIGEWVLEKACQQTKNWQTSGLGLINIAVNLSGRQFKRKELERDLLSILLKVGLNPNCLEIEITESILIKNVALTRQRLNSLKSLGVKVSIDDFGTGYSSLGYLQQFPFDILKIDRCFVHNIDHNSKNAAITQTIITLAHQLNLDVIAEGVETIKELQFLAKHHCNDIQGYLLSPPLPVTEFESLLKRGSFVMPI